LNYVTVQLYQEEDEMHRKVIPLNFHKKMEIMNDLVKR